MYDVNPVQMSQFGDNMKADECTHEFPVNNVIMCMSNTIDRYSVWDILMGPSHSYGGSKADIITKELVELLWIMCFVNKNKYK